MARAGGGAGADRVDPQLLPELVAKVLVGSGLARAAADVFGNSHEWFLSLLTFRFSSPARAPETEATRHTASAKPFRATTFLVRRPRRAGRRGVPGPVRPRSPQRTARAARPGRGRRRARLGGDRPACACRSCRTRRRGCRPTRTPRDRVAERDDDHAPVVEGVVERQDRRLLTAVLGLRRGEGRRQLVGELALLPQVAGLVDELLELRRHVAEARGRAESDAVGPLEVVQRRLGSSRTAARWRPQAWFCEISISEAISSTGRTRTSAPAARRPRRRRSRAHARCRWRCSTPPTPLCCGQPNHS